MNLALYPSRVRSNELLGGTPLGLRLSSSHARNNASSAQPKSTNSQMPQAENVNLPFTAAHGAENSHPATTMRRTGTTAPRNHHARATPQRNPTRTTRQRIGKAQTHSGLPRRVNIPAIPQRLPMPRPNSIAVASMVSLR